ncbi:MAG TPA: patatin-like phospholipase family protein [Solirubrobacteraceae bacterium]|jgi:NTE family protein|nr:patatin-like phospholipase family protein [Solirubrobacteraceae bacterium]
MAAVVEDAVRTEGRVAVVLPGGGARGAYEIGALSVLLPALAARGERVSILCGTSVGAINAAMLASLAAEPVEVQVREALARWASLCKDDVMRPLVGVRAPFTLLRLLGEVLELSGLRLGSLFDAAPLRESLPRWIDFPAIHRAVRAGAVDAVCVVATALSSGASVAFTETRMTLPSVEPGERLRYVSVALDSDHVRASAAIPLLFPPVAVGRPAAARDHYIDGGTRLNSPLKPALALGAERVIVIGLEPFRPRTTRAAPPEAPRLADVTANVLDGLLVDQVGDDLRRLVAINSFFVEGVSSAGSGPSRSARAYRTARGRRPYRRIAYALVSPAQAGEIGRIAERVFRERYGGLRGLRRPDYPLISRALGGQTRSRGELLSFLLFDPVFSAALIDAGQRDARRWLRRHPAFWCADGAHDLGSAGGFDAARVREEQALDEFRALRRR